MYLLDTNILIYSGEPAHSKTLLAFVTDSNNLVSVVSQVETLGYTRITSNQIRYFQSLFRILKHVPIDDKVIQKAIELRQVRKISLGDAFIAASAIVVGADLVTRNTSDFTGIPGLNVINPIDPSLLPVAPSQ
jgi:toxin FitB